MLPALCTLVFHCCSNDQISAIVGLRVKGVAKRVAEKKMRLDLRDTAIQYVDCGGWGLIIAAVADACRKEACMLPVIACWRFVW